MKLKWANGQIQITMNVKEGHLMRDLLSNVPQSCIDMAQDFEGTADLVEDYISQFEGWVGDVDKRDFSNTRFDL